ncbi:pyruvate dehydrogenase complex dihydrolipoyllysine-residue acetyltransferase [Marinobacterium weihaiense]|uniref:Acetyltransferase component of pyruvate dehydrogenase complex n=1 Tax=Marinobacterium weihaiense TaxID=2851016 RepID=A0ABS6MAY4_9GAMM|nr:pyruvate dehydrogenase complex dihydrolipoyllysine-residue acetyltransferase [Marinobacterium weihaiense]MBV0933400.1 pyruvate dehydrogenase complex dihydrolipoyllysine-residue acetyltransferase [Marinobacterium weihaiense]
MTTTTITVPDIGGSENVDIIEVCVSVGDTVAEGDSLIVLETDKASMEVPSTHAGVVKNIIVAEGGTCNEGDAILELEAEGAPQAEAPADAEPAKAEPEVSSESVAQPAASASTASSVESVLVPDLSGAENVDVIEVLVKVGDEIAEGDSLITLETDKASMEVPAPKGGKVVSMKIKEGDQVNEGDLLLELEVAGDVAAASAPATEAAPAEAPAASTAPAAAPAQSGGVEPVTVPDLSGATDVDVIEVLVKAGDEIAEGDSLITLETDKASMEVPAPKGGKVVSVKIQEGAQVNEGDLILELEVAGAPAEAAPASAAAAPKAAAPAPAPAPAKAAPAADKSVDLNALEQKNRKVHAGPAVRALAREFGVELANVSGTGRKNRILKEDVQAYVKSALKQLTEKGSAAAVTAGSGIPPIPPVDFSKFGETEMVKLSKVDKITRDNMSRCWLNIPHVTQFDDADITELEAFRKDMKDAAAKEGVKLTPLPFMIKAAAIALKRHQKFNASLHHDGEHLVLKKYVNIGIAVDTPNGLMVPVIKDADKKSVYELAREATELAGKAKDRKLKPNEMQGACFTISSLGGIGGTGFTPIVNAPEVAILGISKADIKPRWNGKEFEPRMMLPLCLSYDHRAINGGDAGRFLTDLNGLLSDIRRLIL